MAGRLLSRTKPLDGRAGPVRVRASRVAAPVCVPVPERVKTPALLPVAALVVAAAAAPA